MIEAIPSEFAGFIRDIGVRAFDGLAERSKELEVPLRSFVRSWSRLSDADKRALFDELIAAARVPASASKAPAKQTKAVKRYDPEEVAATLPKKPAAPKKAAKKPKAKKK